MHSNPGEMALSIYAPGTVYWLNLDLLYRWVIGERPSFSLKHCLKDTTFIQYVCVYVCVGVNLFFDFMLNTLNCFCMSWWCTKELNYWISLLSLQPRFEPLWQCPPSNIHCHYNFSAISRLNAVNCFSFFDFIKCIKMFLEHWLK